MTDELEPEGEESYRGGQRGGRRYPPSPAETKSTDSLHAFLLLRAKDLWHAYSNDPTSLPYRSVLPLMDELEREHRVQIFSGKERSTVQQLCAELESQDAEGGLTEGEFLGLLERTRPAPVESSPKKSSARTPSPMKSSRKSLPTLPSTVRMPGKFPSAAKRPASSRHRSEHRSDVPNPLDMDSPTPFAYAANGHDSPELLIPDVEGTPLYHMSTPGGQMSPEFGVVESGGNLSRRRNGRRPHPDNRRTPPDAYTSPRTEFSDTGSNSTSSPRRMLFPDVVDGEDRNGSQHDLADVENGETDLNTVSGLRRRCADMKRRLQQSERVHKQTDQQIHDLQHRLEEVEQDLSSKKKECNDLRSREDNLLRQMETLETSVVSLKKLLTSSKTNGTHLRQQLEEQTLAYNQATEALQQKEEELAAFEATRLQFEKEIQQSNEEKAQLEENMKKLQDDLSSTDHAMTELRNENASLKESIELLRGNIEHMGGSMTSLMDFDSVGDLGSKVLERELHDSLVEEERGSIISLSGRRRRSKQRNLSFMVSTQEGDTPVTDGKLLDNLVVTLAPGTPRTPNTPATPKRPKGVPFNPSTPGARAYEDVEQIVNDNNFLRLVPIVREWVDKSIQVNLLPKEAPLSTSTTGNQTKPSATSETTPAAATESIGTQVGTPTGDLLVKGVQTVSSKTVSRGTDPRARSLLLTRTTQTDAKDSATNVGTQASITFDNSANTGVQTGGRFSKAPDVSIAVQCGPDLLGHTAEATQTDEAASVHMATDTDGLKKSMPVETQTEFAHSVSRGDMVTTDTQTDMSHADVSLLSIKQTMRAHMEKEMAERLKNVIPSTDIDNDPRVLELADALGHLEQENSTLQDRIVTLQEEVLETRRTLNYRKHYDAEASRWLESLKEDVQKAEGAVLEAQNEMEKHMGRNEQLTGRITELEEQIMEYRTTIADLSLQLSRAHTPLNRRHIDPWSEDEGDMDGALVSRKLDARRQRMAHIDAMYANAGGPSWFQTIFLLIFTLTSSIYLTAWWVDPIHQSIGVMDWSIIWMDQLVYGPRHWRIEPKPK